MVSRRNEDETALLSSHFKVSLGIVYELSRDFSACNRPFDVMETDFTMEHHRTLEIPGCRRAIIAVSLVHSFWRHLVRVNWTGSYPGVSV